VKRSYLRNNKQRKANEKKLAEFLSKGGQLLASLIEGLEECFTINRLDVPASLHRCLSATNLIESPHMRVSVCGLGESAAGVIAAW